MGRVSGFLFRAICVGFSLVLLVSALLGCIRLAALNEELNALEKSLKTLKEENRVLQAKVESSLSLEELERRAIEELGMQRLSPGQIIYIELG
ncbi:MAG: septum formation initiator family protein [Candidatus Limivicinus sp.]